MNLREAAQRALEALENDPVLKNANNNATAWLRAALAEDVPETNFGNIAQSVDSTEADHIPDATKMIEPVAYVTGYSKGYATVRPVDPCLLMCVGMALYRLPPKRKPLTDAEIKRLYDSLPSKYTLAMFARAVERAHGIGGEE